MILERRFKWAGGKDFERCFILWMKERCRDREFGIMALDGKTIRGERGSTDRERANAYRERMGKRIKAGTGAKKDQREKQGDHGDPEIVETAGRERKHCDNRCYGDPEKDRRDDHQKESRLRAEREKESTEDVRIHPAAHGGKEKRIRKSGAQVYLNIRQRTWPDGTSGILSVHRYPMD